jgi:hypothetical protein
MERRHHRPAEARGRAETAAENRQKKNSGSFEKSDSDPGFLLRSDPDFQRV